MTNIKTTPSEKHLDYLIRLSQADTATPEEAMRKLAKLTWEHAQTRPDTTSIEELVTGSYQNEAALKLRISDTVEIVRNTIKKLHHASIPSEFDWAVRTGPKRIVGVKRELKSATSPTYKDITDDVRRGQTTVQPNDYFVVEYPTPRATTPEQTTTHNVPAFLFSGDPMAVSQHVRKRVHEEAQYNYDRWLAKLTREQNHLKEKIATAETVLRKDLENVTAKIEEFTAVAPYKTRKPRAPRPENLKHAEATAK